ncbi:MAG: carboxypeptidase-like regulatory domain-containing protein [Polyangia bacterium]|nr:carboxypeptidase-like regulatory domain-containing protein [Polyangia bacterium]
MSAQDSASKATASVAPWTGLGHRASGSVVVGLMVLGLSILGSGCMAMDGSMSNNNNSNCDYSIAVTPYSPRVGEPVELAATWQGVCAPNPAGAYEWTITGPDQAPAVFSTRQEGRFVDLIPALAGAYFVELVVDDLSGAGSVHLSRTVTVTDPAGTQETYLLRLTPPGESTAPRQQKVLLVTGGTPISDRVVTLDDGVVVQSTLQGPSGPFAGYLRFVESGYALYRELHATATGEFAMPVLPGAQYDVVVVPDGAEPAPVRLLGLNVTQLLQPGTFQFDAGIPVVGFVEDHSGAGVGQAQAVLRSGDLSSSMGSSDAFDGRFVVWTRPGPQGLEVAPKEGSGLPRVRVPDTAGIQLGSAGGLSLRLRYHEVETATVAVTVMAGEPGQAVPVPGARVTIEASALGAIGTVTATQDGSALFDLDAFGSHRVVAVTDAAGALPSLTLPLGEYQAVIEAPSGAPDGYTTTVLGSLVVEAGTSQLALALSAPARLQGVVLDDLLAPVEGARVVAVTKIGVGSAVEASTGANGAFSLPVVRGASYTLILQPPDGRALARRLVGPVLIGPSAVTEGVGAGPDGAIVLAKGLRVDGVVIHQANGLPGVLVQAIPSEAPGEPVMAEAVTGPSGEFVRVIPDPGVV